MKILKINPKKPEAGEVEIIVNALRRGKTVILPTDTIYGLSCIASGEKAIRRLYRIKQMPPDKPSLILVKSYCMLNKYCYVSQKQREYLNQIWPGPVTVILKSRNLLPDILTGKDQGQALRLPNNKFIITIVKELDFPIISTSLNVHGQKYIDDLSKISENFKKELPDLAVDCGRLSRGKASKLIDLRDIKNIKVLRK